MSFEDPSRLQNPTGQVDQSRAWPAMMGGGPPFLSPWSPTSQDPALADQVLGGRVVRAKAGCEGSPAQKLEIWGLRLWERSGWAEGEGQSLSPTR